MFSYKCENTTLTHPYCITILVISARRPQQLPDPKLGNTLHYNQNTQIWNKLPPTGNSTRDFPT